MVMKWLVSLYKNVDQNIYNAISIYEECRSTMRMNANMSIKFALKLDWDILLRMQKILKGEYEKEKEALKSFHSFIYSADAQKRAQDGVAQIQTLEMRLTNEKICALFMQYGLFV